jgi:hypothetical protein
MGGGGGFKLKKKKNLGMEILNFLKVKKKHRNTTPKNHPKTKKNFK